MSHLESITTQQIASFLSVTVLHQGRKANHKNPWVKPAQSTFAPQFIGLSPVVLLLKHLHISYHYELQMP